MPVRKLLAPFCALAMSASPVLAVDLDNVLIVQRFVANDTGIEQCNKLAYGEKIIGAAAEWSPVIRVDTDNRDGGCEHDIAIVDPTGELKGLEISINFFPDDYASQCKNPGYRTIPINSKLKDVKFVKPMIYDMDNEPGGCQQVYSLKGRNDVMLEVKFEGDDDWSQCENYGTHKVVVAKDAQIRLDTDQRWGGCRLSYRLVENKN
jgi:hypothetical protein